MPGCRSRGAASAGALGQPIRIAVDTLGGDAPPAALVAGALDAVAAQPATVLTFFGDAAVVAPQVASTRHDVVDAPRQLRLEDPLRATLRGGLDSSMRTAVAAVAAGAADAVVSAGSTGALMALSRHLIGMLPGATRPAIVKALAGEGGRTFRLLDLGANIGAGPVQLHQFAGMGVAAAKGAGVALPTVGLLNIGSELRKGPAAVRSAAALFRADAGLDYAGFVEPDAMFGAGPDVVVADGFAGNIALKAAEGAARLACRALTRALHGTGLGEPQRQRLQRVRDAYDAQGRNGALLLGLAGVVVKSHGKADRRGFASAVREAASALSATLVDRVSDQL